MSKLKKTIVVLSDEAKGFLNQIPRGMRSQFVDLLILKAKKQFKSPVEAVRFLMESGLEKSIDRKPGPKAKERGEGNEQP